MEACQIRAATVSSSRSRCNKNKLNINEKVRILYDWKGPLLPCWKQWIKQHKLKWLIFLIKGYFLH